MKKLFKACVLVVVMITVIALPTIAQETTEVVKETNWFIDLLKDNIALILTGVLTLISSWGGIKWIKVKKKLKLIHELIGDVIAAVDDDRITDEEVKEIAEDIRTLLGKTDS